MNFLKMKPHSTGGILITVCGLDGCGKTSLIDKLKNKIESVGDREVFVTKQPTENMRKSDIFRTYMDKENHDEYEGWCRL